MKNDVLAVETNVETFFYTLLDEAANRGDVETSAEARHYLVNLLTHYARAAHLYECSSDGRMTLKPLAGMYAEAVSSISEERRNQALRRLGDVALFVSGVFPESIPRRYVDLEYYIAMGEAAYASLADIVNDSVRWRALANIFEELAGNFPVFVDLLGEVTDQASLSSDEDLLRAYEQWLTTGSARTHRKLLAAGLVPVSPPRQQSLN